MRPRIVVFMGGQEEHAHTSFQSGSWVCQYIPRSRYDITPVEVTSSGAWKVPLGSLPKSGDVRRTMDMLSSVTQPLPPSQALDRILSNPVDSIMTFMRGKGGDDGAMHSMGDMLGIRVAGSNHASSQTASHKHRFSHAIRDIAPTPYSHLIRHGTSSEEAEGVLQEFLPPFFVKPVHGANSHGIIHVQSSRDIHHVLKKIQQTPYDHILQEHLPGMELTVTVFSDSKGGLHTLPPTIVTPKRASFYDYASKRHDSGAHFHPVHDTDKSVVGQAQEIARDVYTSLHCSGIATVDMIANDNAIDVLELNTIPSFHPGSPIHHQLKTAGMHPETLLTTAYGLTSGF